MMTELSENIFVQNSNNESGQSEIVDISKKKKKSHSEIVVFLLFVASYSVISAFHEPWFDEAQAWQIARYCSLKDILFTVGHYEGHPFLWFLILAIPSKLGIPFEIGLKSIAFLISVSAAYLCIFKSPFPKSARCIIPFSYFFFYQYGVIVRQYGLMVLLLLVCAYFFMEKDEKPWRFVIPLCLLCALNAYGIVIAGGVAICWVIDIIREYNCRINLKTIIKDKRFIPLLILLIFALLMIVSIVPYDDTFRKEAQNTPLVCLIVAVCTFLADGFMTTSPFFSVDTILLQTANFSVSFVVAAGIISLVLAALLIIYSSKIKLKYIVVPSFLFLIFSSLVYFTMHHLGLFIAYIVFWCWINYEDNDRFAIGNYFFNKMNGTEQDKRKLKKVGMVILCFCACVNFYWTISASILDIKNEYNCGRNTAKFLKDTGLCQLKVASTWYKYDSYIENADNINNINTLLNGSNTLILSYFDHNFIYTFNGGEDIGYSQHRIIDAEENLENIKKAQDNGIPDVLIGDVNLSLLTDDEVTMEDYAAVYEIKVNHIYKANCTSGVNYIYLRKDLLEQYNLEEIETIQTTFEITLSSEEIQQRIDNGETIEDIVGSVVDQFFEQYMGVK